MLGFFVVFYSLLKVVRKLFSLVRIFLVVAAISYAAQTFLGMSLFPPYLAAFLSFLLVENILNRFWFPLVDEGYLEILPPYPGIISDKNSRLIGYGVIGVFFVVVPQVLNLETHAYIFLGIVSILFIGSVNVVSALAYDNFFHAEKILLIRTRVRDIISFLTINTALLLWSNERNESAVCRGLLRGLLNEYLMNPESDNRARTEVRRALNELDRLSVPEMTASRTEIRNFSAEVLLIVGNLGRVL